MLAPDEKRAEELMVGFRLPGSHSRGYVSRISLDPLQHSLKLHGLELGQRGPVGVVSYLPRVFASFPLLPRPVAPVVSAASGGTFAISPVLRSWIGALRSRAALRRCW